MHKATSLVLAVLAGIATFLLTATANASAADFDARAATSVAGAPEAGALRDRCVETEVYRRSGQPNILDRVVIRNVCDYTLWNVNGHTWNGPANFDWYSTGWVNLAPYQYIESTGLNGWYLPPGSLTCGELWGGSGLLHGRDCKTM